MATIFIFALLLLLATEIAGLHWIHSDSGDWASWLAVFGALSAVAGFMWFVATMPTGWGN